MEDTIIEEGFRLVKYRQLRSSDGRYSHFFAFRTMPKISVATTSNNYDHRAADGCEGLTSSARLGVRVSSEMWIRQDFARDNTAEQNTSLLETHSSASLPTLLFNGHSPSESAETLSRVGDRAAVPLANETMPRVTRLPGSLLPPVAIVGAGLGGSALALSLQKAGVPVVIFEKDASFSKRRQGYALTMQQGSSVLDGSLGISMETLLQPGIGVTSLTHLSLDKTGSKLGVYGATAEAAKRATTARAARRENKRRHNVHIPRQKLRELCYSVWQIFRALKGHTHFFTGAIAETEDKEAGDGKTHGGLWCTGTKSLLIMNTTPRESRCPWWMKGQERSL